MTNDAVLQPFFKKCIYTLLCCQNWMKKNVWMHRVGQETYEEAKGKKLGKQSERVH